jgi:hypothetical protein
MNKMSLDIKYPWPVSTGMVFVSLLLFTAILRGPVHSATVIVAIGSLALTIYALAYRIPSLSGRPQLTLEALPSTDIGLFRKEAA